MPITVHEIGPDGQLVQTTIGDEPTTPAASAASEAVDTNGASAPPTDAPDANTAAPAPEEPAPPDSAPAVPEIPETTTPEEEDEEAPVPLSKGVQRRIDRLTRQREEARRAQAALEERLRMLEQGYQRPAPEPPTAPPSQDPADYATQEEWIEARIQQSLAREREQWQLEQLRQRQQQEQQARDAQWATREQTFKQQHPDYEERLQEVLPRLSPQLGQGLSDSEMAPELVYHLARHPDELQRLNGLQPLALSRALGRLEQQLSAPPPARPTSPTPKPAPPTPLNGAGQTGPRLLTELSDADIEAMSLAEFDAAYKRQFGRVR